MMARGLLAFAAFLLLAPAAFAKPPPGTLPGPEHEWWEAQQQRNGESCCGAPGSDGHVLQDGDWRPQPIRAKADAWPFQVRVRWTHLGAKHSEWMDVPASVVVAPRDLPEPSAVNRTKAKVWYSPTWGEDGAPIVRDWRWYCFEPVEGV
jgi:hypothetical protein